MFPSSQSDAVAPIRAQRPSSRTRCRKDAERVCQGSDNDGNWDSGVSQRVKVERGAPTPLPDTDTFSGDHRPRVGMKTGSAQRGVKRCNRQSGDAHGIALKQGACMAYFSQRGDPVMPIRHPIDASEPKLTKKNEINPSHNGLWCIPLQRAEHPCHAASPDWWMETGAQLRFHRAMDRLVIGFWRIQPSVVSKSTILRPIGCTDCLRMSPTGTS